MIAEPHATGVLQEQHLPPLLCKRALLMHAMGLGNAQSPTSVPALRTRRSEGRPDVGALAVLQVGEQPQRGAPSAR